MAIQFLKSFLTSLLQLLIQSYVPAVKMHVHIMPEPHPASPFISGTSPRTMKDVMLIQVDHAPGNPAFLVSLQD